MKKRTLYFLIVVFTVIFSSCNQLNSDNWQWEKPADWRLPLLSDFPTVILNYLPADQLNIVGNTIAKLSDTEAQNILKEGLEIMASPFDTIFTPSTKDKIDFFKNNTLTTTATEIGTLINTLISEVERREEYPQVLEDFIPVIDALVKKIEGENLDALIDTFNRISIDRNVANVDIDLNNLIGSDNVESIKQGTLFLDISQNTMPFTINFAIVLSFSDGTSPTQQSFTLKPGEINHDLSIIITKNELVKLKTASGKLHGTIVGIDKDNLPKLLTGKLVAALRLKIETNKMLISF